MDLDELRRAGITPAPEVPGYPHHVVGFGDLDEDLPPIASQLLADLLPGYTKARRKWPLWTYECRHPREVTVPSVSEGRYMARHPFLG